MLRGRKPPIKIKKEEVIKMNEIRTITKEQAENIRDLDKTGHSYLDFANAVEYHVDENDNIVCSELSSDKIEKVQVI